MARFEKVDPKDGSFRAPLGFAVVLADIGVPLGVGINASGVVVKGAAGTAARVVGVICPSSLHDLGDPIDVMTDGEIVDLASRAAGDQVYADATTGVLSTTNTGARIGFMVQSWRLIVRVARG